jgi:hypothetical protein
VKPDSFELTLIKTVTICAWNNIAVFFRIKFFALLTSKKQLKNGKK